MMRSASGSTDAEPTRAAGIADQPAEIASSSRVAADTSPGLKQGLRNPAPRFSLLLSVSTTRSDGSLPPQNTNSGSTP
jgi:hypothetical protein